MSEISGQRPDQAHTPGPRTVPFFGLFAQLSSFFLSHRIAGTPGTPEIEFAQMRIVAESQDIPFPYAFPVLTALYAASLMGEIHWPWLVAPIALHFLCNWYCLQTNHRFLAASPAPSDIDYWRRQFLFIGFCYSSVVASFAWFFWVPDNQVLQTYLLCVMALALIPMVLINSSYRPLMLVVMPPMVFALAARLLLYGDVTHSVFAVMLLMFSVLVVRIATQTNSSVVEAIRLKEDKDALIDELYRAKRDSDMARAKAEDANRAKSQFLANMSHELRTPLNAIIGFSEVMSTELLGKHTVANYRDYAEDIHRSGQHLLGLINDVLDLSRIEAGRVAISEETVTIQGLAEDSRRILDIRAQAQKIEITEDIPPHLPPVLADGRTLRQIWINILTNAIKFSPTHSTVHLYAHIDEAGDLHFGVQDEGPGIPEGEIDKVLEAFTQGASGIAQPGTGSGLGLAIVRGLMEAHGGRFDLISRPGEGTRANCVLPAWRLGAVDPGDRRRHSA
ncbi:two-component system cell cycle sensor histidine kinase PleC [Parvibaculum indicum]|uniref:sensor histidine kinase n=1 Tax=Parvibaculum indicum TaxID=562969 RepID=UPI00141FEE23|nr:ATP-binding protein [Parvibaculum indicum]NIJ42007.1 two-component system cell cycle sensor histidine kinase PleC [Parvibaculum indicum]